MTQLGAELLASAFGSFVWCCLNWVVLQASCRMKKSFSKADVKAKCNTSLQIAFGLGREDGHRSQGNVIDVIGWDAVIRCLAQHWGALLRPVCFESGPVADKGRVCREKRTHVSRKAARINCQ